jgi:hypothetical protein
MYVERVVPCMSFRFYLGRCWRRVYVSCFGIFMDSCISRWFLIPFRHGCIWCFQTRHTRVVACWWICRHNFCRRKSLIFTLVIAIVIVRYTSVVLSFVISLSLLLLCYWVDVSRGSRRFLWSTRDRPLAPPSGLTTNIGSSPFCSTTWYIWFSQ